jgi:hypothetical protein
LSARYSGSPTLDLRIGESRLRAVLHAMLCMVCLYALYLIHARGHTGGMVLLALLVVYLLQRLRRDPLVAAKLLWRQGLWTLEQQGVCRDISLTRRCVVTPWVIYLAFIYESEGPRGHLWLYADSAAHTQLRRLRVRLTLER